MKIDIQTKFDIGDKVWALLPRAEVEPYYDYMHAKHWEHALYEKEIIAVRYFQDKDEQCIQYFLDGMHCYEGENWFNEPSDTDDMNDFWNDRIFTNFGEANKFYNRYKFFNISIDIQNKLQNILNNKDLIIKDMKL